MFHFPGPVPPAPFPGSTTLKTPPADCPTGAGHNDLRKPIQGPDPGLPPLPVEAVRAIPAPGFPVFR